ncbi:MAG: hypothetical protein K0S56_3434 [Microvirga sp.]|jgi:hypothetical protein|nr:hypothetical protein [Microvirga sp.]
MNGLRHPIESLHERLSSKIEKGRSVQLSPSDLDWLVISGAYAALLEHVAREAFDRSKRRLEAQGHDLSIFDRQTDDVPVPAFEPSAPLATAEDDREVLTPAQIGERWGVTATAVIAHMKAGRLRHFKIGSRLYRARRVEVESYEAEYGVPQHAK